MHELIPNPSHKRQTYEKLYIYMWAKNKKKYDIEKNTELITSFFHEVSAAQNCTSTRLSRS